jgi:hypothetical protein
MNTSQTTPAAKSENDTYISNPFRSTFRGLNRILTTNQNPAIFILVVSFFGYISNIFPTPTGGPTDNGTAGTESINLPGEVIAILVILGIVLSVGIAYLTIIFYGMSNYIAWKSSKDQTTTIKEAFNESHKRFWRILAITIITVLKIIGGLFLLIIPGIRASLRYTMVLFPMFDEDLNASDSVKRIKHLTKGHLMEIFGIYTVAQLIFPIAIWLQMGGEAILYPQMKHLKDNDLPKPPTHWLNYLGIVLWFSLFMFFALITVAIVLLLQK